MATNDDTIIPSQEDVKASKLAQKKQEKLNAQVEAERAEKAEAEGKIDADVAKRTSHYDQDLKERARAVGINPDNFAEEHVLGEAVTKAEAEAEAEKENENV